MQLALTLTPPSQQHFKWAAQVGVTDYVARYPSVNTPQKRRAECERAQSYGLRLSIIEGYLPMNPIIRGTDERDAALAEIAALVEDMGRLGIGTLCYNFMPLDDWTRTAFDVPARGGALTNEFDLGALDGKLAAPKKRIDAAKLWENLTIFLHEIVPVAEKAGVQLALHPDDPPISRLLGADQIMHTPAAFARLFEIEPNPANGMCLCTGTFGAAGEDVLALIEQFGARIHYVHFRNMAGQVPHFVEPFHDDGDLAMPAILRALHKAGFRGSLRPDHVPQMDGESGLADGYSMLGRLFAVGYLRGLMDSFRVQGSEF